MTFNLNVGYGHVQKFLAKYRLPMLPNGQYPTSLDEIPEETFDCYCTFLNKLALT